MRAFSSCGERGLLFGVVRGLLIAIKACQMEKEKLERQLKQHCYPQMYFPTSNYGWNFHLRDPCLLTGPGAVQDLQRFPPDCQWYAPDLFPPDVQDKANGFSSEKKANA
ncbi:hypothetical protein J1605_011703 [Eschrichtius robustus]|uniref:Uncharacterized protein n=1 Tax=Eschrichtius robustus TaxID=9764 RepID=A0AB34GPS0_ESCRO|nr:hypothetical protein J1605_011703 [Eschrichtius robustus]